MADDDAAAVVDSSAAESSPVTESTPAGDQAADTEGRARRMGWRPKDEFRGDPSRWTDAETFIQRGEQELPILRDRYRALDDKFAKQSDELKEVKDRLGEIGSAFKEFREFNKDAAQRAYTRAKREIEAKMQQAVELADKPAYTTAKAELDELEESHRAQPKAPEQPKQPEAPKPPPVDPEITRWINENPWYVGNRDMQVVATAIHGQLVQDSPHLSMRDNLAEVKKRIMKQFPDQFTNPRREEASAVSEPKGGNAPPKKTGGKTFADLPAEAKQAYERFKRDIPDYKKEEYAAMYFAGEE